jgi:hypothetical protein
VGTKYGLEDLRAGVRALEGGRLTDFGRTLNMVEVGVSRGDDIVRLHVQCPFRLVLRDKVVLGSADMRYPLKGANPDTAYEDYATQYDRLAKILTAALDERVHPVIRADLLPGGAILLESIDDIRLEVFPDVSGPIECWRLFVKDVEGHLVYRARQPQS